MSNPKAVMFPPQLFALGLICTLKLFGHIEADWRPPGRNLQNWKNWRQHQQRNALKKTAKL